MEYAIFEDLEDSYDYKKRSGFIPDIPVHTSPARVREDYREFERQGFVCDPSSYDDIHTMLTYPGVLEEDEKDKIRMNLTNDYKKYIFSKILDSFPDEIEAKVFNRTSSVYSGMKLKKEDIKEILLTGNIPEEFKKYQFNYVAFMGFLKDFPCDYYELPEESLEPLDYITTIAPKIMEQTDNYTKEQDELKIKSLFANHSKIEERTVHVNEEFKREFIESIPKEFNDLEKGIYAYFKLCDIFNYNPYYYGYDVVHVGGMKKNIFTSITTDPENISKLKPGDDVVCYQFSYALTDILSSMNIMSYDNVLFSTDGTFVDNHSYGGFVVDGTLVYTDSTTTADLGDLSTSDYNHQTVGGIRCGNLSEEGINKFNNAYNNVINYMIENDKTYDLKNIVEEYDKLKWKSNGITLKDKMNFMYEKILEYPNNNVSLISFVYQLKNIIFDKDDEQSRFSFDVFADENYKLKIACNFGGNKDAKYVLDCDTKEMSKVTPLELNQMKSWNSSSSKAM